MNDYYFKLLNLREISVAGLAFLENMLKPANTATPTNISIMMQIIIYLGLDFSISFLTVIVTLLV